MPCARPTPSRPPPTFPVQDDTVRLVARGEFVPAGVEVPEGGAVQYVVSLVELEKVCGRAGRGVVGGGRREGE